MLIYPIFIQQRGCPFHCIYCDQTKFGSTLPIPLEVIRNQLSDFCTAHRGMPKQIAFYGGTFTAMSETEQEKYYHLAEPFLDEYTSLRLSTRPDYVGPNELEWCVAHKVETIELGIQDFDDTVLQMSGRGYDSQTAIDACRRVTLAGIELGIQLMPGLPGHSPLCIVNTARTLRELHTRYLRVYPVVALGGTVLWDMVQAGIYLPLSLEAAINICADYCTFAENLGINVIKIGIPSLEKGTVYAGPYHPALGELVRGEILIRRISSQYTDQPEIFLAATEISLLTAHQGYNMRKLMQQLGTSLQKVTADNRLPRGDIRFSSVSTFDPIISDYEAK